MAKYYNFTLPITRKNYSSTKAARFKGTIQFVCNRFGIIYDWKINLTKIEIDTYTTKSWFENLNAIFRHREKLFKLIGLKQIIRPDSKNPLNKGVPKNNLFDLDAKQISEVNRYLNDRKLYKSTINNIVGVLKGNNPVGKASKPSSAEMIIDSITQNPNFVILFDDLTVEIGERKFDLFYIGSDKIFLSEYINLDKTQSIKKAYDFMQKEKSDTEFSIYLNSIREFVKKNRDNFEEIEKLVSKERSKYSKNVEEISTYPFNMRSSEEFQKAHIVPVYYIRELILDKARNGEPFEHLLKMVSDSNNFIPLPDIIHRKFDQRILTYKTNGSLKPLNNKGKKFIDSFVANKEYFCKFIKIDNFFLTKERINYINKRNNEYL